MSRSTRSSFYRCSLLVCSLGLATLSASATEETEPTKGGKPLSHWTAALKDPDSDVRAQAESNLRRMGGPAVPVLINMLKDKNPRTRFLVARIMRHIGAEEMGRNRAAAVEALVEALEDKDDLARVWAANALSEIIGPDAGDAIPILIKKFQDNNFMVRFHAANALSKIGPEAVPDLIEALKDKNARSRTEAVRALHKIGPLAKQSVPALIEVLNDEDTEVRYRAAYALGAIGPDARAAIPALRNLADDDKQFAVRSAASKSLRLIEK